MERQRTEWPHRRKPPAAKPLPAYTHTHPYDSLPATARQDTHHPYTEREREGGAIQDKMSITCKEVAAFSEYI